MQILEQVTPELIVSRLDHYFHHFTDPNEPIYPKLIRDIIFYGTISNMFGRIAISCYTDKKNKEEDDEDNIMAFDSLTMEMFEAFCDNDSKRKPLIKRLLKIPYHKQNPEYLNYIELIDFGLNKLQESNIRIAFATRFSRFEAMDHTCSCCNGKMDVKYRKPEDCDHKHNVVRIRSDVRIVCADCGSIVIE